MIRARFNANLEDPRSVKWPIKYPFWISGHGEDYSIVIAYADNEAQIKEYWPEATNIESAEVKEIVYTDRFPKPDWYMELDADFNEE